MRSSTGKTVRTGSQSTGFSSLTSAGTVKLMVQLWPGLMITSFASSQGPDAPGGKKSYVVNGDMSGGFALLAYPAKYAFSGVMTFVVGQDGVVYQKDLGPDTGTQAPSVAEYNPDKSWTAVQVP